MGSLAGLRVLLTGANGDIGLAIARRLVQADARLCISGRNLDRVEAARAAIRAVGGDPLTQVFDIQDPIACRSAVQVASEQLGGIDALINSAGVYQANAFLDTTARDFEDLFRTNVVGCANLMQAVLPQMLDRQNGRIVNIASTAGKWGSVYQSAYNASKHALVGLTRCVALETVKLGVTVNAVCPGLVKSAMAESLWAEKDRIARSDPYTAGDEVVPQRSTRGRLVEPAEIAELVAYLLSPMAAGMTGQSLLYDGGGLQI